MTKSTGKRPYRPKLTPDELERAKELLELGRSYNSAARTIGCTGATLWYHFRGIHPRRWQPLSDDDRRTAQRMLDDGASASEVGRTLGVTPRAILNHFPGRGWSQDQTTDHQRALRRFDDAYTGFGADR